MGSKDWDVEQFKTEHECDEHWELRRSFLLAHRDKFPEDRLVCLAQVFTNVEFLGCRYPAETMRLVAELSQGVADEYRQKQKGRLQRTFVQASDAAGAKAKGLKRPLQEEGTSQSSSSGPSEPKQNPSHSNQSEQQNKSNSESQSQPVTVKMPLQNFVTSKSQPQTSTIAQVTYGPSLNPPAQSQNSSQSGASANGATSRLNSSRYGGVKTYHIDPFRSQKHLQTSSSIVDGPYGKMVLVELADDSQASLNILQHSASVCQLRLEMKYEQTTPAQVTCFIYLNGKLLSSALEFSRKASTRKAADVGLEKLRETCYTIKTKLKYLSDTTIDKTLSAVSNTEVESSDVSSPVAENSVGSRLLRLMGWSGGGLGKDAQGIQEPVSVQEHVNRAGLGLSKKGGSDFRQFKDKVQRLMQDYAHGSSQYDLVFSTEFTKEERKTMHLIATNLKLKTKSFGKFPDRHLVVFKRIDVWDTLEQLLKSGSSTERYDLIKPTGPKSR